MPFSEYYAQENTPSWDRGRQVGHIGCTADSGESGGSGLDHIRLSHACGSTTQDRLSTSILGGLPDDPSWSNGWRSRGRGYWMRDTDRIRVIVKRACIFDFVYSVIPTFKW